MLGVGRSEGSPDVQINRKVFSDCVSSYVSNVDVRIAEFS